MLVVICGQPCSGKSRIASALAALFQEAGLPVEVVSEHSLHLERNAAYSGTVNEKNTRGQLKSRVERVISRKSVTILDSINNIKGYRYELWCVARAAGTRYCMVHVDTDVATCGEWNAARPEGERYSQAIFDDLAGRFERPDARNRWDAPLFTLHPATGLGRTSVGDADVQEAEVLAAVVNAMTNEPGNVQAKLARELTPTMATTNPALLATNTLHEIDTAAQDVVNALMEAQASSAGGSGPQLVRIPAAASGSGSGSAAGPGPGSGSGSAWIELDLARPVSLAELRRHKRAFLKLATKITFARLSDAGAARRMFVDYLRTQLAAESGGGGGAGGAGMPDF